MVITAANYILAAILILVGLASTAILARIGYSIIKNNAMIVMIMTFTAIALCGIAFLIWLNTKNGKKWLASL